MPGSLMVLSFLVFACSLFRLHCLTDWKNGRLSRKVRHNIIYSLMFLTSFIIFGMLTLACLIESQKGG